LVSDDELDRLQDVYVDAARLAARAGFDGVDVKACHRYLVSELLASFTREGKYGGSLENRARFLLDVVGRVRAEVPGIFATARINVYDAIPHPYGFGVDRENYEVPDLREPIEVIRRLESLGAPAVNVTIGNPYYKPHYGRPYDRPVAGVPVAEEHPLEGVARFVEITRQVQQAVPRLPIVATGYSWLRHLMPYVAAGVVRRGWATFIGQGRGAFAYPDSVRDILTHGRMDPQKTCIACSGCSQIMRDGTMTGCVVRDSAIYAEQYKLGRRYAIDRLMEQARRCRDCVFPACTAQCPARVDVPAFIRAFADDRLQEAYDVLRRTNVLPEMCAHVCPAEVQCEGGCIERIFTEHALPIRDLQLAVSRLARQAGMTGVPLPEATSGKRVAVVGGGPAGLACAIRLLEKGHCVTLFEQQSRLGGTPDATIPATRYCEASEEVDAILAPARAAGRIECRLGVSLGQDMSLAELRGDFDAVFLALGLGRSVGLAQAEGVYDALTWLRDVKRGKIQSLPERVAVLGAGNTAVDAALTARQLGARDVFVVYRRSLAEMPTWPEERQRLIDSGCQLLLLTQPLGYQTDGKGTLTGLRIARTELGPPDASGRRSPRAVEGTESVLAVEAVIEALGQAIPPSLLAALDGLDFTRHGLLATRGESRATSLAGIFAGGDLTNGGTTAVRGIAEGMEAAEEIHGFLS
jgi:NADPH-dependent glutamate synthase beta subunit-like oxidoreductase/2,4-dienoyl-CoA reductase-like NADH-dependent reductase (Old Yellow Enzyme family)